MKLFSQQQEQAEAAAAEMLRDGTNVKTLQLMTVVRPGSPEYEQMRNGKRVVVAAFAKEGVTFTVVLN